MTDYYDLMGVESGADKEVVRAAYRDRLEGASQSERAKLNKAWNVLSDPVQRGRYDEYLAGDSEFGGDDGDDDDVPTRPVRSGRATRERASRERAPRPARPPLEPTIELPRGMEFAPKRSRNMALLFDASVILVISLVCQFLGGSVIRDQYPVMTKNMETLNQQIDRSDADQSKAEEARDKAEKNKNSEAAAIAKADAKVAEKRSEKLTKELLGKDKKLRGAYFLLFVVVLILSLLYTVGLSYRTGQTLGKKRQGVRLVRLDGSVPGVGTALVHYGLPLAVALLLFGIVGPLALLAALGMVLWSLRDRNRQGVHDKLAKTLVVVDAD